MTALQDRLTQEELELKNGGGGLQPLVTGQVGVFECLVVQLVPAYQFPQFWVL